jgi:nucleotide-binding universal stress UspA family protein
MSLTQFLKRILVAADGSVSSLMAEETTAIIAKKTKATVTVFYVRQDFDIGYQLPRNVEEEIISHLEQQAEKILNDAQALFNEEKVSVETKLSRNGDPADRILDLCNDYDLIIIGAHGENEKDLYALGSVTKKVM